MKKLVNRFLRGNLVLSGVIILSALSVYGQNVQEITTAAEYRQKYATEAKTVNIKLPSGAVFKLRPLTGRAFSRLLVESDISMSEYSLLVQKKYEEMSVGEMKKFLAFWNMLLIKCVERPKLCIEKEEGKLSVDELTVDDLVKLEEEIITLIWPETTTDLDFKPISPKREQK